MDVNSVPQNAKRRILLVLPAERDRQLFRGLCIGRDIAIEDVRNKRLAAKPIQKKGYHLYVIDGKIFDIKTKEEALKLASNDSDASWIIFFNGIKSLEEAKQTTGSPVYFLNDPYKFSEARTAVLGVINFLKGFADERRLEYCSNYVYGRSSAPQH
jgi:hypothetical protein